MSETAIDNCYRCYGTGWMWRVTPGFHPIQTVGLTASAKYKVECGCKQASLRQVATTPEDQAQ